MINSFAQFCSKQFLIEMNYPNSFSFKSHGGNSELTPGPQKMTSSLFQSPSITLQKFSFFYAI